MLISLRSFLFFTVIPLIYLIYYIQMNKFNMPFITGLFLSFLFHSSPGNNLRSWV